MNTALIYRPNNRKLIWLAFACAITIHLGAIALAENKSRIVAPDLTSSGNEVQGVDVPPSDPPEVVDVSPSEQPVITDDADFYDDKMTTPIRPRKKMPTSPVRSTGAGQTMAMRGGSAKALALYAPRPNYPYEARRGGTTGSGIAQLTVNSESGSVIEARMSQSTGSAVLDYATLSAFRTWRFRPGVATNVDVPITYTLAGVSY